MARITMIVGGLLTLLGLVGYFVLAAPDAEGHKSITAMIPAFFGLPIAILGMVALNDRLCMHAMHAAVLLALIGLAGALMRPVKALIGGTFELSTAAGVQMLMAAICAVFLILCVRSFINVRRGRSAP